MFEGTYRVADYLSEKVLCQHCDQRFDPEDMSSSGQCKGCRSKRQAAWYAATIEDRRQARRARQARRTPEQKARAAARMRAYRKRLKSEE